MNGRLRSPRGLVPPVLALVLVFLFAAGCDYSPPSETVTPTSHVTLGPVPQGRSYTGGAGSRGGSGRRSSEQRKAILENSITLIQRAAEQPGGEHFAQAVRKLNQYFEGTDPRDYQLDSAVAEFLTPQLGPQGIQKLQSQNWEQRDTRHIEDCMMYYNVANRVAGTGDDLTRVRRVFAWLTSQVQLVPIRAFGGGRLGPAIARPYDVLLRGMASELEGGIVAERSWVFMSLCRQLGIDVGLIAYNRGGSVEAPLSQQPGSSRRSSHQRLVWTCGALIGDQIYLFDTRLGLEVPGPGGQGVATLAQALEDSAILERMNLPGLAPYPTSRGALLASPSKISILIDSSPGYFSPKMKLLQRELSGQNRAILYCDAARERDGFLHALGSHAGFVALWEVPVQVDARAHTPGFDPDYIPSVQASLFWFQREFPLVYARVKQLRGNINEAVEDYTRMRFGENKPTVTDKKKTIDKPVQQGIDVYAAYYMALAHLERNNLDLAARMFRQVLDAVPEFSQDGRTPIAHYAWFRWGADTNLGRIEEAQHKDRAAIDYYTRPNTSPEQIANWLRARELLWKDPFAR